MKKQIKFNLRHSARLQMIYSLLHTSLLLYLAKATSYLIENIQFYDVKSMIIQLTFFISSWIVCGIVSIKLREKLYVRREIDNFFVKTKVFEAMLQAPQYKVKSSGTVLEYIQGDLQRVLAYYGKRLPNIFIASITLLIVFIYSVYTYWGAAIVMLVFSSIQIISPLLVKRVLQKQYLDCRKIEGELTDLLLDANLGAEEIKVFQAEKWILHIMEKKHHEYKKIGMKSEIAYTKQVMCSNFIRQIITYGFYMVLGVFCFYERVSFSEMMTLVVLSSSYYEKMQLLFDEIPEISLDQISLERLNEWEEQKPDNQNGQEVSMKNLQNQVQLHIRNIYHSYGDTLVFEKFSIDIPLFQKVALLGENGSGKSTLLKIIGGIEIPEAGIVFSDTAFYDELLKAKQIAYLSQDCGGIQFAICDLLPVTSLDTFMCYADQFELELDCLKKSLCELSGGQRKKIYLSVIFSLGKKIILLDEPTNDLDEKGKEILLNMIQRYDGGIVYVTHDIQLAEIADIQIQVTKLTCEKRGSDE